MQQIKNGRNHPYKALVTQGVAIKRKMGKKCFCVTTEILHTKKTAHKNTLPSRESSSKVA